MAFFWGFSAYADIFVYSFVCICTPTNYGIFCFCFAFCIRRHVVYILHGICMPKACSSILERNLFSSSIIGPRQATTRKKCLHMHIQARKKLWNFFVRFLHTQTFCLRMICMPKICGIFVLFCVLQYRTSCLHLVY